MRRNPTTEKRRALTDELRLIAVVVVAAVAVLAGFGIAGAVLEEPFRVFTKEPLEQFPDAPPYVGVLAHLTWFLWAIGGAVAAFTAALLWRSPGARRDARFLLAAAALTAALMFDDVVMFHERVLPKLGIPEEALYAGYAAALVAIVVRFGSLVRRRDALVLLAAGTAWALSLGADVLQEHFGIHAHAVEDGAKTVGTALWAAYLLRWSGAALSGERARDTHGTR